LQVVHAANNFYRRPWFDSVQVFAGHGYQSHYAQLRLLFRYLARTVSGRIQEVQFALVRWYKKLGPPSVLGSYGCIRLGWESQSSYLQVIPLACIVRREYVVPDFSREELFYVIPFKVDRSVPDKRPHKSVEEDSSEDSSDEDYGMRERGTSDSESQ